MPAVGYGKGLVGTVRNWINYISEYNSWVEKGYSKFSKKNISFLIPSGASRPQEIVIPPSQTKWLLEQPDNILSSLHALNDVLFSRYNFLGKRYADDQYGVHVVHMSLSRNLPALIPGLEEEIEHAIDSILGHDKANWKSVNIWDFWLAVVPKVVTRMLVGYPVCRDERFLQSMIHFVDCVLENIYILNLFPKILHPIVGRLITLRNEWYWRTAFNITKKPMEQRLRDMDEKEAGNPEYKDWEAPEDFMTWMIRVAKSEKRLNELTPLAISKRTLPVEFAAIHTTILTGHSLILNLFASDPSKGFIDGIRDEATQILEEEGGHWTKHGLQRMLRTDSAIRESMRLSEVGASLTKRMVVAKEGITNPAEGWHAAYGSLLMLSATPVHHDEDLYQNAHEYDAFRYSRIRQSYDLKPNEEKSEDETVKMMNLSMVSTSDKHLAFGHGRHACPGRFFVAHELKIILAYMTQRYHIKPLEARPKPQWIGQTIIPPLKTMMEVKRRK
ncbi:hypothetical protein ACHAPA_012249 [Fusarium lateritium]